MTDELYEEGMDWQKLSQTDILDNITEKVATIMGPVMYRDSLILGIRPLEAFAETFLADYMHRVLMPDPDDTVELKQEFLIPMASNPEGGYELKSLRDMSLEGITCRYCLHRETGAHREYDPTKEAKDYDIHEIHLTRTEIVTILRLNLQFRNFDPAVQEKWLRYQIEQHEKLTGEEI